MDKSEIAMQLTLKAMDNKVIPHIGISSTGDIGKTVEENGAQVANLYNQILKKLD